MTIDTPAGTVSVKGGRGAGAIRRTALRGAVVASATALLFGGIAGAASAAPGDTSSDTVDANVEVNSAIVLTGLTPEFTLVGLPGTTVTGIREVTYSVETNNIGGYTVTVQAATPTLEPETAGNPDSIPIQNLRVRETPADTTSTLGWIPLSSTNPVLIHDQDTRSAEGGDEISNDYQVSIPFVADDTYDTTLTYIATAS